MPTTVRVTPPTWIWPPSPCTPTIGQASTEQGDASRYDVVHCADRVALNGGFDRRQSVGIGEDDVGARLGAGRESRQGGEGDVLVLHHAHTTGRDDAGDFLRGADPVPGHEIVERCCGRGCGQIRGNNHRGGGIHIKPVVDLRADGLPQAEGNDEKPGADRYAGSLAESPQGPSREDRDGVAERSLIT